MRWRPIPRWEPNLKMTLFVAPYNPPSVHYCTDIYRREFYSYRIELHLRIVFFAFCVSLNKMNLHDHRLAAILQIRTALVARMFELRDLRRRVQTAQLSPRRLRRVAKRRPHLGRRPLAKSPTLSSPVK